MCHTSDKNVIEVTFHPPVSHKYDTKYDTKCIPKDVEIPGGSCRLFFVPDFTFSGSTHHTDPFLLEIRPKFMPKIGPKLVHETPKIGLKISESAGSPRSHRTHVRPQYLLTAERLFDLRSTWPAGPAAAGQGPGPAAPVRCCCSWPRSAAAAAAAGPVPGRPPFRSAADAPPRAAAGPAPGSSDLLQMSPAPLLQLLQLAPLQDLPICCSWPAAAGPAPGSSDLL